MGQNLEEFGAWSISGFMESFLEIGKWEGRGACSSLTPGACSQFALFVLMTSGLNFTFNDFKRNSDPNYW